MKLCVTFGNSVMTLHWEENLVAIFLLPKKETQLKFRYWLILHSIKCMTCSQILLTCDPQYFQWRVSLNSCIFWSFRDGKTGKMTLTSLNVYTTSHPLHQRSLYVSRHWLPVRILEAAIPLARWKVNLRRPSMGCCQIQTTQWNSLHLILIRLGYQQLWWWFDKKI